MSNLSAFIRINYVANEHMSEDAVQFLEEYRPLFNEHDTVRISLHDHEFAVFHICSTVDQKHLITFRFWNNQEDKLRTVFRFLEQKEKFLDYSEFCTELRALVEMDDAVFDL